MKIIKHNIFALFLVIVIIVLAACGAFFKNEFSKSCVGISDISGDRNNLNDIKISGLLADSKLKLEFDIENGNVKRNLSATEKDELNKFNFNPLLSRSELLPHLQEDDLPKETDKSVTVYTNKADAFFEMSTRNGYLFSIKTDIVFKTVNKDIDIHLSNRGNGLVQTGCGGRIYIGENQYNYVRKNTSTGRVYVYTITYEDFTGYGGAYDITEQINLTEDDNELAPGEKIISAHGYGINRLDLKNIAPIDLKGGNVRIAGMETVGNVLLFITFVDNDVVLKPFDLTKNIFLDDINLGSYNFADKSYAQHYEYFGFSNDKYISLAFSLEESEVYENDNRMLVAVYDAESNSIILKCIEQYRKTDGSNRITKLNMKYKNDKLFSLREDEISSRNIKTGVITKYPYGNVSDYELRITVFGGNKSIYDGLIISDISDDRLFQGDLNRLQSPLYYRYYYGLSLE